jgi:hypothetical protein
MSEMEDRIERGAVDMMVLMGRINETINDYLAGYEKDDVAAHATAVYGALVCTLCAELAAAPPSVREFMLDTIPDKMREGVAMVLAEKPDA